MVIRRGRVDIVDDKAHPIIADSLSEVGDYYAAQMGLHARGAARLWPEREVHAWLLFTAYGQSIEIPVGEETAAAPQVTGWIAAQHRHCKDDLWLIPRSSSRSRNRALSNSL